MMEPISKTLNEVMNRVNRIPLTSSERTADMPLQANPESRKTDILLKAGVSRRHVNASRTDIEAKRWALLEGFKSGSSYFLFGIPGTGKTHMAVALMRETISSPDTMRFVTMADLLLKIKATFEPCADESETYVINHYSKVPCLILDDIGVEKPTEWTLQTLYTIIDRRYRNMEQTVFTSNLSLKELADRLGERIPSRIAEMCGPDNILHITGPDRRLERR